MPCEGMELTILEKLGITVPSKVSPWYEMFCHDGEVMGLNTNWIELRDM